VKGCGPSINSVLLIFRATERLRQFSRGLWLVENLLYLESMRPQDTLWHVYGRKLYAFLRAYLRR
jgi:hypothetical protein